MARTQEATCSAARASEDAARRLLAPLECDRLYGGGH